MVAADRVLAPAAVARSAVAHAAATEERRTFQALDGLRGVAALSVVFHHIASWPTGFPQLIPQASQAVDLFFVMSGFVLAHAYAGRLAAGLSAPRFMLIRVIRLWPLHALAIAIVIGCLAPGLFTPHPPSRLHLLATTLFSLAFLPVPTALSTDPRSPFPLNLPAWSLFFELAVNILWATVFPRAGRRTLAVLLVGALLVFAVVGLQAGSMSLGWTVRLLPGSFARVTFGFFAGLIAYRIWAARRPPDLDGHVWLPMALIATVVALAVPVPGPVFQLAIVLAAPPFVYFLARLRVGGFQGWIMNQLGIASYAVYVLHTPILLLYMTLWPLAFSGPHPDHGIVIAAAVVATTFSAALLLDRYYDRVVRSRLSRWLLR